MGRVQARERSASVTPEVHDIAYADALACCQGLMLESFTWWFLVRKRHSICGSNALVIPDYLQMQHTTKNT